MNLEDCKKRAAEKAATLVKDHMIVGIGTGSTVFYFIEKLISLCKEGLQIKAVSSSNKSTELAKKGGIPFIDINTISEIDITVDGADEIDTKNRMIKGGGGALLREKILAYSSKNVVIIVDASKVATKLGKRKLPVEISPFAPKATISKIEKLGYKGSIRKSTTGEIFFTDNNNLIFDITFDRLLDHPEKIHLDLIGIPGVMETGLFFNLAKKVFIAYEDGHIEERG